MFKDRTIRHETLTLTCQKPHDLLGGYRRPIKLESPIITGRLLADGRRGRESECHGAKCVTGSPVYRSI